MTQNNESPLMGKLTAEDNYNAAAKVLVQPAIQQIIAGDKSKGAKYIAEHPEEYGFTWEFGKLGRGTGKDYVEYATDFPHVFVKPEQVPLFVASFGPGLVAQAINGTSIKVSCDRVNRESYDKNNRVGETELKEKLVSSVLLKVITRSGFATTKYVVDGQVFTSEAEAKKYTENTRRIKALEAAQAFLAMAAENGVDTALARQMAQTQWPEAFEKENN